MQINQNSIHNAYFELMTPPSVYNYNQWFKNGALHFWASDMSEAHLFNFTPHYVKTKAQDDVIITGNKTKKSPNRIFFH